MNSTKYKRTDSETVRAGRMHQESGEGYKREKKTRHDKVDDVVERLATKM